MQATFVRPQISIVRLQGHVNAANAAEVQRQLTTAVTSRESSMILVDMEQVETLDSAGLMALVSVLRLAHHLNCRFSLCSVSPSIRIIFELTELDRVFEIFATKTAFSEAVELVVA